MDYRITALLIALAFYGIYLGKMLAQRKKGIQTDQMAKGNKPRKVILTECFVKISSCAAPAAILFSVILMPSVHPIRGAVGLCIAAAGAAVFGCAVWTMRDSWRAGIPDGDHTEMITGGVYGFSRNPAFLGFDLLYIGFTAAFFNWILLGFSIFAIAMLHLQILLEEQYLPAVFGQSYLAYKERVGRYIGRKNKGA